MRILDVSEEYLEALLEAGKGQKFARTASLFSAYPDLQVVTDSMGKEYVCSESINREVDCVDIQVKEGLVVATTYVVLPLEGKLHANPPFRLIGYPSIGFGMVPFEDWRDQLDADHLPDCIKLTITRWFAARPPISW